MPKLGANPTVARTATVWTREFAAAVRDAAGSSGRLTPAKADAMTGPYADNARNYFSATGKSWSNADTVIESGAHYVRDRAERAAGANGKLSLADIEKLPADLKDDVLILRGKLSPASAPAGLEGLKAAVRATEINAINDYGTHITVGTYPASKSREDILRDLVGYDDLSDSEVSSWFDSTRGARAVTDFQSAMGEIGHDERENADNDSDGRDLERRFNGVGSAAKELFKTSSFKSLELVEHFIAEDGDMEHRVLIAKQKDDSWLVLAYSDFPF